MQIRAWLDTDAAQYTKLPILVANEGQARLELFKEGALIDTVHIYRYSRDELNELLEEMGQERDQSRNWDSLKAAQKFDDMVNNWGTYSTIAKESDKRAQLEREYDEQQAAKKQAEEDEAQKNADTEEDEAQKNADTHAEL